MTWLWILLLMLGVDGTAAVTLLVVRDFRRATRELELTQAEADRAPNWRHPDPAFEAWADQAIADLSDSTTKLQIVASYEQRVLGT